MELEEYVQFLAESDRESPDDSTPRRLLKRAIPMELRGALKQLATRLGASFWRRRAQKLERDPEPLRLHLGCGATKKPGWVNIDLAGANVDLAWDITDPLPFQDGAVDVIFHEHLLEHLSLAKGLSLMRECHRLLKEGGVLRVAVPNCRNYLTAYASGDTLLDDLKPGRPTPLLAASEVFLRHGHRSAYDLETLTLLCKAGGFSAVRESSYGSGQIRPSPDSEHRRRESLYVESVKVAGDTALLLDQIAPAPAEWDSHEAGRLAS
jgi:predicted SAM-dependent methyltransferase